MADSGTSDGSLKNKVNLSVDLRYVIIFLVLVIAAMLFLWKPWTEASTSDDRTVTVTGDAQVKAEPDEYVFYPTYEFKDANKEAALAALTKKSEEVTKGLKDLGVAENKIKTNSDAHNYPEYFLDKNTGQNTYNLRLTVTVNDKELTQKVQDYLVNTSPLGQISPATSFSEEKRKELESQARDQATKDARAKADQAAKNIGFKVGKVKSIDDGSGFGGVQPMPARDMMLSSGAEARSSSLSVQPGENELNYSVKVVYYVR